ncbi:MAG: hypothetical protein LBV32_03915 [Tannerellaceae bacterium]|jgi:Spy/CpxP family protein refolding chaperone|nr:hypothetical protein [Tannerellaceae bacterium]
MRNIFFITFATISMLISIETTAQENDRDGLFNREAFEAKRNAFITAEIGLTPEEAAKFIPLCDELRRKRFEIGKDCRNQSREIRKKENATASEYTKAVDTCLEAGIKEAELDKEYYEKFKKILSPEKLYKYRDAEFKFARQFMREDHGQRGRRENQRER